jgi:DASS family divalent anion:Na+ symporter
MESLRLAVSHRPALPLPTSHGHLRHRHLHLQPSPNSLSLSLPISPHLTPTPTTRRHLPPILASASSSAVASPSPAPKPAAAAAGGAKPLPLLISLAAGLAVRFLVPRPAEVTPQAWQLLSIFLSTIAGLVLGPLPVGAWAFLGLTATVATRTLPFTAAFGAFTNEVIWLIVISFFFARGFVKTGLGDRVATYFVKWLGRSTLGLSYGLAISEAFIAPAMPSTTARAGGIFLPIVKSLSLSSGSKPNDPSAKKLGSYLVQSQLQVTNNEIDVAGACRLWFKSKMLQIFRIRENHPVSPAIQLSATTITIPIQ